jgi:hypothetical protein
LVAVLVVVLLKFFIPLSVTVVATTRVAVLVPWLVVASASVVACGVYDESP